MFPIKDNIPSAHPPYVNYTLIALNVLVFLWEESLGPALQQAAELLGFVPARFVNLLAHDPLASFPVIVIPLVTSIFLHAGWLHLLANVWFLWVFGDNVEDTLGHIGYLLFYLACGVGANLIYLLFAPTSLVPLVGASGAIAGVMGAYFNLFPGARILTLIIIIFIPTFWELPAYFFLGIWFLLQFLYGTLSSAHGTAGQAGVGWWAHVGGFLVGMLLIRTLLPHRVRRLFHRQPG